MSETVGSPYVSVIMPVYNAGVALATVLTAIRASTFQDFELITVDDGSDDDSGAVLRRHGADVVLRNVTPQGPFAARNQAVTQARGTILFFTDADVVLQADTIARVVEQLPGPDSGAVIGLYREPEAGDDLCTYFKTAWVRFSYLQAPENASWFFTAVGGLRREAWERCGPFRPEFSRQTGGGDIEYGRRLVAHGVPIRLDKTLAVQHLKRFTLGSLLRNDYHRAHGYCALALRTRWRRGLRPPAAAQVGIANVGDSFVLGVISAALMTASLLAAWPWAITVLLAAAWLGSNLRFLSYLFRLGRWAKALAASGLLFVDQLVCGAGVVRAVGGVLLRRPPPLNGP